MQIDHNFVQYLEDLSCLTLSTSERSQMAEDLQKIIAGISKISELNTDGAPECIQPFDNVNVFRDDKVFPSLNRDLVLKNAPVKNDEFFIAPKTVEQ